MTLSMQCSTWLATVCCICIPAVRRARLHTQTPAVHLMQSASMHPSVTVRVAYATHVPADKPAGEAAVSLVGGGQAEMHIAEAP